MKKKKLKILLVLSLVILKTGCTKNLTDSNNKIVKNEKTGQTLTKNILCKPTKEYTTKIYKKNKINVDKLPECKEFKITSGKYEGLWANIFVKPLAFILIQVGIIIGNYGVSVILISLAIRFIAFPITKKTAIKQNQEMMAVYKKYGINPMSGCLFAFLQLPIFIAFFEAVQRVPVIFEDKFLGLQLGTTPSVGITSPTFYSYLILMILIAGTTFFSFKMNTSTNQEDPTMKMMPTMMSVMIVITAIFMPTGLGIYWVTSNLFTIAQNILVKRSKVVHGKA